MTAFGSLQPNITLKTVSDLLKRKAVHTFLKKMIPFQRLFLSQSGIYSPYLPDEIEVSGKCLPLSPFISSDNDAYSDELRIGLVTFECQSQGRIPSHSLYQGPKLNSSREFTLRLDFCEHCSGKRVGQGIKPKIGNRDENICIWQIRKFIHY